MDQQVVANLLQLLHQTTQPDTSAVQAATAALKEQYKNPQSVLALFEIGISAPEKNIRQLAAVELRKLVHSDDSSPWTGVPQEIRDQIKVKALEAVLKEPESIVRHSLARVISAIAAIEMPHGQWNDLLPFVETACRSPSAIHREVGAFILFSVLEVVVEGLQNQVAVFLQLYDTLINDPESLEVRIVSVRGLGVLAGYIDLEDKKEIKAFQALVPTIFRVIEQCVQAGNEDGSRNSFDALSTFLILEAPLLSKNVPDLVQFLVHLGANRNVDAEYRNMALNALIMTIKYKKSKIQSLSLGKPLLEALMPVIAEEDTDDEEEETPCRLAVRALDSLATSLPPQQIFPSLYDIAQVYAASADPNQRRAALLSLGVVVEGCSEFMRPYMDKLWPFVDNGFKDPDASVRKAACTCLGCITEWLEETCIERHAILVPAVLSLIHDPIAQQSACTALDGLLEHLGGIIGQYLVPLMETLSTLLETGPNKVKAVVVGAIGSAAHAAKAEFIPYFQPTIQRLVPFLQLAGDGEEEELRGIAMDACGTFAEAVGAEAFKEYFEPLMKNAYTCVTSPSSRLRECAFLFFGVMARLYGEAFAAYLPNVVPAFIQSIKQDELGEESALDGLGALLAGDAGTSSDNAIRIPAETAIDIENIDADQLMKVNSAIAIEKEIAVDTLGDLFAATKTHFLPYIEPATLEVVQCLGHYYEGIRKASISTLVKFLVVFYEIGDPAQWTSGLHHSPPLGPNVQKLLEHIMPDMLDIFETEDDRSVASTLCQDLAEAIIKIGPNMVVPYLDQLCTHAVRILEGKSLAQIDPDEEEDDDPASPEELAELDGMLISSCMDLVSALATVLGPDFGQAFGTFLPLITQYCGDKHARTDRTATIGTIGEIMTSMKGGITPFTEPLYQTISKALVDSDAEVRSNASFAMGVLVENTDADLSSQYLAILGQLQPFFAVGADASKADLHGRDNAAGAVARLVTKNSAALPLDQVLPVLFGALPLKADRLEWLPVFRAIFHLFQTNPDYAINYVDQLLPIFAYVLNPEGDDEIGDENRTQLIQLLQAIESRQPGKVSGAGLGAFIAH